MLINHEAAYLFYSGYSTHAHQKGERLSGPLSRKCVDIHGCRPTPVNVIAVPLAATQVRSRLTLWDGRCCNISVALQKSALLRLRAILLLVCARQVSCPSQRFYCVRDMEMVRLNRERRVGWELKSPCSVPPCQAFFFSRPHRMLATRASSSFFRN